MKKLKVYLLLVGLIYANVCFAQSGWVWQNPLPSGNALSSVRFINALTGFAASDKGLILKSTNGGQNWALLQTGTDAWLYSLEFINMNTGVAVGEKGTIIKTSNGGLNWYSVPSGVASSFYRVFFVNNNTGWICGDSSKIFYTTNSGESWINRSPSYTYHYRSLHFIDENTGWVAANGFGILKTENGGLNWNYIDLGINLTNGNKTDIQFINTTTGWLIASYQPGLSTYYRILKSTNGGLNWNIHTSSTIWYLSDLHFVDSLYGWAVGNSENLRTTDGGITWNLQTGYSLTSVFFINRTMGWTIGDYGHSLYSTNSGVNWVNTDTAVTYDAFNNIYFSNADIGLLGTSSGKLFNTSNGGLNWSIKYNFGLPALSKIDFQNANSGWVVFAIGGGRVFHTTSSGNNWQDKSIGNPGGMYTEARCIKFINNETGFVGTNSNQSISIYKTNNYGTNWYNSFFRANVLYEAYLRSVYFINSQTGWMCGGGGLTGNGEGIILKTTNQGDNWSTIYTASSEPYDFQEIYFVNDLTGWVCGRKGIMKTINGGLNWYTQFLSENTHIFRSIFFVNSNTGWSVDNRSNSYITTNSGNDWLLQYNPARRLFTKVYFLNENTGFILGDLGTILKTTDAGGSFILSVNNINKKIPDIFVLFQNYPNPFNPQTKIKFDIPANMKGETTPEAGRLSNVKLVIYDLLGREVATLVNEELSPGTYEADWDASSFSSGVYFYKIISGEFVETKKMVLMK